MEERQKEQTHHTKKPVFILVYFFLIVFLSVQFLFHTLSLIIINLLEIISKYQFSWPLTIPVIGYSLFNLMPHLFGPLGYFQIFAINNTFIAIYVN